MACGGPSGGCGGAAPVARPAPVAGEYRISSNGVIGAVAGADLSAGPMQFLGAWDTRPDERVHDADIASSLGARAMPGGVTLRWGLPRAGDPATSSPPPNPGQVLSGAVALRLFVAGVDAVPPTQGWRTLATWPGELPSGADDSESYNRAWVLALQTTSRAQRGGIAWRNNGDALQLLSRHYARPVLELLSYAGAPWCEADLGELAGGTRYVAAWLQQVWSRTNGVDPIGSHVYALPWVIAAGAPRAPVHRRVWHCAFPMASGHIAAEGDLFSESAVLGQKSYRVGIASPIAGRWSVHARHNGLAGADPMFVGLELRGSMPIERAHFELAIDDTDVGATLEREHGGAATIAVGAVGAGSISGALVHVSVTGCGGGSGVGLGV